MSQINPKKCLQILHSQFNYRTLRTFSFSFLFFIFVWQNLKLSVFDVWNFQRFKIRINEYIIESIGIQFSLHSANLKPYLCLTSLGQVGPQKCLAWSVYVYWLKNPIYLIVEWMPVLARWKITILFLWIILTLQYTWLWSECLCLWDEKSQFCSSELSLHSNIPGLEVNACAGEIKNHNFVYLNYPHDPIYLVVKWMPVLVR